MQVRELTVPDTYEFLSQRFPDERGTFVAPFQEQAFVDAVGHRLQVAQSNVSVSGRGVIRGIHFADVPPGQAKYVYCTRGAVLDVAVDVRVGSPNFGTWDAVYLDPSSCRAVYLAEGVGHAFLALSDEATVAYLCSTAYNPSAEHGISPLDPELALPWPSDVDFVLSEKDRAAPTLAEAQSDGILPSYDECLARYTELQVTSSSAQPRW